MFDSRFKLLERNPLSPSFHTNVDTRWSNGYLVCCWYNFGTCLELRSESKAEDVVSPRVVQAVRPKIC